jgi:transcription antitermination factor NusG
LAADWSVAMTHPAREFVAARTVRRQYHRLYYLPQFFDSRLKRRRPLFPGYLFVHAPKSDVGFLRSCTGISRVICNGDKPAMLDNSIIDGLRAQENDNGVIAMENAKRGFRRGDKVRILYQNMNHLEAFFECTTARQRVKLLLCWLGQTVPVIVPIDQIERAA